MMVTSNAGVFNFMHRSAKIFEGSNVSITQDGQPYLGSLIGTPNFVCQFVVTKLS